MKDTGTTTSSMDRWVLRKFFFDRELFFCGPRNMKIFLNFAKYNDTDIDLKQ
jgi:hypothetical protein